MRTHDPSRAEKLACDIKNAWDKMTGEPDPREVRRHELHRWRSSFGPLRDSQVSIRDTWKSVVLYRIWDDASQSNPLNHEDAPGLFFIARSVNSCPHANLRSPDSRVAALRSHMDWKCDGESSPFISTTTDVNWIYSEGLRRAMEGIRGKIRVTAMSARIRAAYELPILSAEKNATKYGIKRSNWLAGNLGWDAGDDILLPLAVIEEEVLCSKRWEDIQDQKRFERWVQSVADEVEKREEEALRKLHG